MSKTSAGSDRWIVVQEPVRLPTVVQGLVWLGVLLGPTLVLTPNLILAQTPPSRSSVPPTGNSRPASEDLLGIDPSELELGKPAWEATPSLPARNPAPGRRSTNADPSLPDRHPSATARSDHRNPNSTGNGTTNLDEFFSAEMKALLEGSARPRLESSPTDSNRSPMSPQLQSTIDRSNGGSSNPSNPLRSNDGRHQTPRVGSRASAPAAPMSQPPNSISSIAKPSGSPPRTLGNAGDVRPLMSSNPKPQSLLAESGIIGLLSNESEDSIDLPPPHSVDNADPSANPTEMRTPRRNEPTPSGLSQMNRSLAETITSPNLPIQIGFHADELDTNDSRDASIKNRLNSADFEALVQQQSSDRKTLPVAEAGPGSLAAIQSNRPVAARLLAFDEMRQQFNGSFADEETPVAGTELLAEVNYWIWRGEFEKARDQIAKLNSAEDQGSDPWEAAWLNAEIAIGLKDPGLLEKAERQMLQLRPRHGSLRTDQGLESIYGEYVSANRSLLKADPDYVSAVAGLRRVLEQIPSQISQATPWARQRLSWILLHSQLQMARCIALGPYRSAPTSADEWFKQASATTEQLIQAQIAAPLLRLSVATQQIECYAEAGRFRDIPPLLNYLATWEHQLQIQGQSDDSLWIRQQTTAHLLRCGLLAYNHQQIRLASNWVQQVIPRLERPGQTSLEKNVSLDSAAAYWLQGAIQLQAGQSAPAVRSFDVALQNLPTDLDQLSTTQRLEWGERFAIMAVAYWNQDDMPRALQLNQDAVVSIQNAIDAGLAMPDRIETPLANLAVMTLSSKAIVGSATLDGIETDAAVRFASAESATDGSATTPAGAELGEIREQLENPIAVGHEQSMTVPNSTTSKPVVTSGPAPSTPIHQPEVAAPRSNVPYRNRLPARARLR